MLFGLLAGCPFIFGPADFSGVDRGRTASDGGTAPDTGLTTTTTPTGSAPGVAPVIRSFTIEPSVSGFLFQAVITDADGDLDGGSIQVQGDGMLLSYDLPQDVVMTDDLARFIVPADDPCSSWSASFTLTAVDRAQHESLPVALATAGDGGGTVMDLEYPNTAALGRIDRPFVVCATLDGLQDFDGFSFSVKDTGDASLRVSWDSNHNIDFDLWDRADTQDMLATGWSVFEPESVEQRLVAGHTYDLFVYYFDEPGFSDLYALSVVPAP